MAGAYCIHMLVSNDTHKVSRTDRPIDKYIPKCSKPRAEDVNYDQMESLPSQD